MGSAELRSGDVEERLRDTMRRRALDVQPRRPSWDTLAAVHRGSAAASVRQGGGRGSAGGSFPGWVRPVAAAASVLMIVLAGAVVLDRSGTGGTDDAEDAQIAGQTSVPAASGEHEVPAPGSEEFDLRDASPAYPVLDEARLAGLPADELDVLTDPLRVATDYLEAVGLVDGRGSIGEVRVDVATDTDQPTPDHTRWEETGEVAMAWSTWGEGSPALASGHVYLRRADLLALDGRTPDGVWIVVGARAQGLRLDQVGREGTALTFVVDRDRDDLGAGPIRVEVNGRTVQDGRVVAGRSQEEFEVPVPQDEVAVVRVQHLDGGDPVSVTTMAVASRPSP